MDNGLPYQAEQEFLFVVATTALPSQGFPLNATSTRIMNSRCIAGYTRLIGYVITDQAGNVFVDQSVDGVTYDIVDTTPIVGGTALPINQILYGKVCRVRIQNTAGVAQSYFRGNLVARPL